jgi:hypothetical protein
VHGLHNLECDLILLGEDLLEIAIVSVSPSNSANCVFVFKAFSEISTR